MVFIETSIFTRQVRSLISDDHLRALQQWLAAYPAAGNLVKGTGGCRKLRWMIAGKGKRGGIRVIYYWMREQDQILMLFAYSKSSSADLSAEQIEVLGKLVKREIRSIENG
jgi:hypothetical protein